MYVSGRVLPKEGHEEMDAEFKHVLVTALMSALLMSLQQIRAASVVVNSPSRLTLELASFLCMI